MHEQTIYAIIIMALLWLSDAIGFRKAHRRKRKELEEALVHRSKGEERLRLDHDRLREKMKEYVSLLDTTGKQLSTVQQKSNEQRVLIEQLRTIPHIQKAHLLDDGTALFIDYTIDDKTFTSLVAMSDVTRTDGTSFTRDALKELFESINERCSTMVGPVD